MLASQAETQKCSSVFVAQREGVIGIHFTGNAEVMF